MAASRLRAIPSVDKILRAVGDTGLPSPVVVDAVRRHLASLRSRSGRPTADRRQQTISSFDAVVTDVRQRLRVLRASRIAPVINGTGILVHTNLGRAPLSADSVRALTAVGGGYSTLEYSLSDGARSGRAAYLEHALAILCRAEAATVVNNNAAALVLILEHFCGSGSSRSRRADAPEVIISRGELLQIGGGFRIPDILEARGARLREVGTTNQTGVGDYARAMNRNTALILKVHRSNFFMDGFVDSPSTQDLAALAKKKRVPFVEDLGSGAIVRTEIIEGVEHEPTPAEVLKHGVDLVCFSGDKLFGGPQAGIIAGRKRMIDALKRQALFRALRCDKLVLSALEATADAHLHDTATPVVEMMRIPIDELRSRADRIVAALNGRPLEARIGTGRAQVGGGTLPRSGLTSVTIDLSHPTLGAQALASRLRDQPEPVIAYIGRGAVKLDLRTIFPHQDPSVIRALVAIAEG